MKFWRAILLLFACFTAAAAEVIPPAPTDFFTDYANVTSYATQKRLNSALWDFERQTSSQIWVAIYPTMQTDSSLEDYSVRVFRAWKVGLKGKDNGAVLFVFVKEHKMRIATGYGLEGALPDALCKRILDDEITPRFKAGDFDGGLTAGVNAMIAAAKGEYKGTGKTYAQTVRHGEGGSAVFGVIGVGIFLFFFFLIFILGLKNSMRRGGSFGGSGWWIAANVLDSIANSRGGWSSGGGGWGSSGGGGGGWSSGSGGAMGGGGSTGGGGASGSW